jgi:hypothetical protein
MAQIKIISEQTVLSSLPNRTGKQDLWVLYQVGDDTGKFDPTRTFQVFVPYEEVYDAGAKLLRADVVTQHIKDAEARRTPASPRTFSI